MHAHYGRYKFFSEFLCKNESTTLVIKMDEQQVLKSIVNNCKTSDPTSRMIFWCLCFREFSQLAHIGQAPPLTSHVSLDMSVAADVSDWIVAPAPLNINKCGENAVFSSDNSIVQRRDPENRGGGCVCYTVHPLPPGQVWQTTVLETTTGWGVGLVSGCVPSLLYTKTS